MIVDLTNKKIWPEKNNWIDNNGVVFGYDMNSQCCEGFGIGVYDPKTRKLIAESPAGLDYHFDFKRGASETHVPAFKEDVSDITAQVWLVPDNPRSHKPDLVFECWLDHNGYYYHDFGFDVIDNLLTTQDRIRFDLEGTPLPKIIKS